MESRQPRIPSHPHPCGDLTTTSFWGDSQYSFYLGGTYGSRERDISLNDVKRGDDSLQADSPLLIAVSERQITSVIISLGPVSSPRSERKDRRGAGRAPIRDRHPQSDSLAKGKLPMLSPDVSRLAGDYQLNRLWRPSWLRQQMDGWFCIEQEQSPRGKNRGQKNSKKLFTRSSRARQESFFPLTKTYHGSPVQESNVSQKADCFLISANVLSGH